LALSNLLLLLRQQRNRRTCYNFAGLGIEYLHHLSMIAMRARLRPPIQFLQPPSHLLSVLFTSMAKFTVWMVEFQEGQQVASQIHDKPRGIQFIRLKTCASSLKWQELIFEAASYYATRRGYRSDGCEAFSCGGFSAKFLFRRPSINRSSSAISSGRLCLPPLWISSSRCINFTRSSITSSKASKAGWFADHKPTRRERIACASINNWYQSMPSRMKVSDSTHDKR
jgi:hypothetical protein